MLAVKSQGVAAAAVESRRHACGQCQRVNLARVAVIAFSVIVAAEGAFIVFADNRADKFTAADCRVGETVLNRAIGIYARNAANFLIAAEFAADRAVINRTVKVTARNAADIPTVADDVDIGKVEVLNRAAVVLAEQAAISAAVRYLEVAYRVVAAVKCASERIIVVADCRPVHAVKVNVTRELERQTVAVVTAVYVSRKSQKLFLRADFVSVFVVIVGCARVCKFRNRRDADNVNRLVVAERVAVSVARLGESLAVDTQARYRLVICIVADAEIERRAQFVVSLIADSLLEVVAARVSFRDTFGQVESVIFSRARAVVGV